jgi:hypothetical protein
MKLLLSVNQGRSGFIGGLSLALAHWHVWSMIFIQSELLHLHLVGQLVAGLRFEIL